MQPRAACFRAAHNYQHAWAMRIGRRASDAKPSETSGCNLPNARKLFRASNGLSVPGKRSVSNRSVPAALEKKFKTALQFDSLAGARAKPAGSLWITG